MTYPVWRLLMYAPACQFSSNEIDAYQSLLLKVDKGKRGIPLTCADWYKQEDFGH